VVAQLREMALRMAAMLSLIDRSLVDTYSAFSKIDRDGDGYVTREDLHLGLENLNLGMTPEALKQYAECQFMCADTDVDGRLSFAEYSKLHQEQERALAKFHAHDKDGDGLINKEEFGRLVGELQLALDETMCRNYVDMNFRFADRSFRGGISLGQFLASYATLLATQSGREKRSCAESDSNSVGSKKAGLVSRVLTRMTSNSNVHNHNGNTGRNSSEHTRPDARTDVQPFHS